MNDPDHNEALKPCPFCNGKATQMTQGWTPDFYIMCEKCHSTTRLVKSSEQARHNWNFRVQIDEKLPLYDDVSTPKTSYASTTQEISALRSRLSQAEAQGAEMRKALEMSFIYQIGGKEMNPHMYVERVLKYPLGKDILERLRLAEEVIEMFKADLDCYSSGRVQKAVAAYDAHIDKQAAPVLDVAATPECCTHTSIIDTNPSQCALCGKIFDDAGGAD